MNTLVQNLRTTVKLVAVLVILVVANLAAARYDQEWDMTTAQLYSLSPKTEQTVANLDRKVTLYFFHTDQQQSGRADPGLMRRLLKRYEDQSDRVDFQEVDPTRNPNLAREYNIRQNNTIVVKVGERTNTLNSFDLYEYGGRTRRRRRGSRKFRGETAVTSAIIKLTETTDRVIHFTTGHGEYDHQSARNRSASEWVSGLEQEGYTVQSLKPLVGELPDTHDMIVVLGPRRGFSAEAGRRLRRWHRRGGHLILAASPASGSSLNPALKGSGLRFVDAYVVASRSRRAPMAPLMFTPELKQHPAVSGLREQGLTLLAGPGGYLEVDGDTARKILTLGPEAYAKPPVDPDEEFELAFNPEQDSKGPFTLAASARNDAGGRLIAIASARLFANGLFRQAPGNHNLAINIVNWMFERQVSLSISPVPLDYNSVQVTSAQAITLQVMALVVLPLGILVWGGTVWWKRRNR